MNCRHMSALVVTQVAPETCHWATRRPFRRLTPLGAAPTAPLWQTASDGLELGTVLHEVNQIYPFLEGR